MEQSEFNLEKYRELWQKESQQLQEHELFSPDKVLNLIRSPYRSQYQRRCRNKNIQIILLVVFLLASLVGFYATLVYSPFFWIVVSSLVVLSLVVALSICSYDRYLLWRIHPYKRYQMSDKLVQISQKLNNRYQRQSKLLSFFVDLSHPQHHRIRWASVISTTVGSVAVVVVFCFLFPVINSQHSQLAIDNTHHVVCNKTSCDATKYYQIVKSTLTMQDYYVQPQNQ